MEQHPIPQQISSYQFRLVGDMTLKQFFQVAAGALISLLIYSTPLHPVLKWPLIVFFSGLGAALAFVPFQERPLEKWILAFFKSIYSPTMYHWRPYATVPVFFQKEEVQTQQTTQGDTSTQTAPSNNSSGNTFMTNLEEAENSFLKKLGTLFSSVPTITSTNTGPQISATAPVTNPNPVQEIKVPVAAPATTNIAPQSFTANKVVVQEVKTETVAPTQQITTSQVGQVFNSQNIQGTQAQFSVEAAPPLPPENPNLVVGQVIDSQGKIVESAILEIKDDQGRPVRALRSNKAGHFMIVTPLLNGKYELSVEKEGLQFDPLIFETNGSIIPPIAVRAKNSLVQN